MIILRGCWAVIRRNEWLQLIIVVFLYTVMHFWTSSWKNQTDDHTKFGVSEGEMEFYAPPVKDSTVVDQGPVVDQEPMTTTNPVFVLSFPNSGQLTIIRYFKCGGLHDGIPESLGRRWSTYHQDKPLYGKWQMGRCIAYNLEKNAYGEDNNNSNPLEGCGTFRVWTEMESCQRIHTGQDRRQCFFPSLYTGFLERLLKTYPQATIINVIRNPNDWYDTLPKRYQERWSRWCNHRHHDIIFPSGYNKTEWLQVYEAHHERIRRVVRAHPTATLMEIRLGDWTKKAFYTVELSKHLGIFQYCWLRESLQPALDKSDIRFPVFNLALPKSATSSIHEYLNCGLGSKEGAHQWIIPDSYGKSKTEDSHDPITVAHCMQNNLQPQGGKDILDGCGDTLHFSDIGVIRKDTGCFYPSMSSEWYDALVRDYPGATIMNVVRDPEAWYRSAERWNNLTARWSLRCPEGMFPPQGASQEEWIRFYNNHTETIREVAKKNPSLTYIELKLDDATKMKSVLNQYFGFRESCLGHSNDNTNAEAVAKRFRKKSKETEGAEFR